MSIHWADVIAEKLEGSGPHTIATGITPSGPVHIGNMREVMTAEAVYRALLDRGVEARLIYIADTYDRLRRLYPFLPESFTEHIGKPLSEIPCPKGCCASYAEHFLTPFLASMERLGIKPEVFRADVLYKEGAYNEAIKTALRRKDDIARILKEVSGRDVPEGWSPFDAICSSCGRTNTTHVTGFDLEAETVDYQCSCGSSGTVSMSGGGKLVWRVDWPARWPIFHVTVEPFGKDHATAGGSYDTGKRISEEIYSYPAPFPMVYEWIHLKGVGAMHSSTGIVVTIQEMLDVVPPEVLRYLIIRNKPEKHIEFDPALPLLSLVDEYDQRKGDERAIRAVQCLQERALRDPLPPHGHRSPDRPGRPGGALPGTQALRLRHHHQAGGDHRPGQECANLAGQIRTGLCQIPGPGVAASRGQKSYTIGAAEPGHPRRAFGRQERS